LLGSPRLRLSQKLYVLAELFGPVATAALYISIKYEDERETYLM
jgi:hypothetical protein